MKATRRQALVGALAVPTAASVPAMARPGHAVVVYDPQLTQLVPPGARPIAGDPVRFAQGLFNDRPSLVLGISHHADRLMIADVGREAGYREVAAPASLGSRGWALAPAAVP